MEETTPMRTNPSIFLHGRLPRFFCLQLLMLFLGIGSPCRAETSSRPDPEGVPTQVEAGVFVLDLSTIDEVEQTFGADFYLYLSWRDARLAVEPSEGSPLGRVPLEEVWHPRVGVLNLRSFQKHFDELVEVSQDGTVFYRQRFFGQLGTELDYREFPFDEHELPIIVVSFEYAADEVEFQTVPGGRFGSDRISLLGWKVGPIVASVDMPEEQQLFDRRTVSRLDVRIPVTREPGFYLWKIVFPLTLIVAMSWAVFWINPSNLGAQVSVASLSFLILRVFWFNIQYLLPKTSYLNRIDIFLLGSTLLVFLAFVEAVCTGWFAGRDRTPLAERIDQWAWRLFPFGLLFLVLFGLLL